MKATVKNLFILLITSILITTNQVGYSQAETLDSPSTSVTSETSSAFKSEASSVSDVLDNDIAERVLHELTRPEYNGRVTGTEEIWQVALFLANVYQDIGLGPWVGDSFIMTYTNVDAIELIDESMR